MHNAAIAVIAFLFFLYGARIEPRDAYAGLVNWRMHLTVLAFTFGVFPLIGLVLRAAPDALLDPALYPGVLFLCLVPSTVQASVGFTSLSRGNVPAAIASASMSNLVGVFLTPALALALMTTSGHTPVQRSAIYLLALELFVPFLVGQLARPLVGAWVGRHPTMVRHVGRTSIELVIYGAFSSGEREGVWHAVTWGGIGQLVVLSTLLVAAMLWLTRDVATRLGFGRADMLAIEFCGTKKALVTGLPMASVLFAGGNVDLVVLPLMVFHHVQLIMCAWLANRYARAPGDVVPAGVGDDGSDDRSDGEEQWDP